MLILAVPLPNADNAYATPGMWKNWGPSFYAPAGRIHWAGADYATSFLVRPGCSSCSCLGRA